MIDFRNIRHTTAGLECHYLGCRNSCDQVIHRFAIVNAAGERFEYYNEQGQRIEHVAPGKWEVRKDGHQIIEQKPPKIVEVTRWVCFYRDAGCIDDFHVVVTVGMPDPCSSLAFAEKHTFRFEVPHE